MLEPGHIIAGQANVKQSIRGKIVRGNFWGGQSSLIGVDRINEDFKRFRTIGQSGRTQLLNRIRKEVSIDVTRRSQCVRIEIPLDDSVVIRGTLRSWNENSVSQGPGEPFRIGYPHSQDQRFESGRFQVIQMERGGRVIEASFVGRVIIDIKL